MDVIFDTYRGKLRMAEAERAKVVEKHFIAMMRELNIPSAAAVPHVKAARPAGVTATDSATADELQIVEATRKRGRPPKKVVRQPTADLSSSSAATTTTTTTSTTVRDNITVSSHDSTKRNSKKRKFDSVFEEEENSVTTDSDDDDDDDRTSDYKPPRSSVSGSKRTKLSITTEEVK